jgi:ATP-dependent DNA helicase PIF1
MEQHMLDEALHAIGRHLASCGGKKLADFNLPTPAAQGVGRQQGVAGADLVQRERDRWNPDIGERIWRDRTMAHRQGPTLNDAQMQAFAEISAAIQEVMQPNSEPRPRVFFVDGLGGAGKTFLYNTLLAFVRSRSCQNQVAIPVASSGIAALLLKGGRTAHSKLKIPIRLDDASTCYVSAQSDYAHFLMASVLTLWDEVGMMHKFAVEAVDRTFRDIMSLVDPRCEHVPFGGLVVVFGGDFRQVPPVLPKASRGQVVNASLRRSRKVWPHVRVLPLHENMRVQRLIAEGQDATKQRDWALWLQRIGEGLEEVFPEAGVDMIRVPEDLVCKKMGAEPGQQEYTEDIADLIEDVYGGMGGMRDQPTELRKFLLERAILTTCNSEVDAINAKVMALFEAAGQQPDKERVYLSADTVLEEDTSNLYTTEFLNTLLPSGIPPHELRLKVGCPIMLLRNLPGGLANGTRLIVTKLMDHIIEAELVQEGNNRAQPRRVFIPRLDLIPSDETQFPFTLRRRHFPVRPAFAMTINKSQGQTLHKMGLYLSKSVFSHGQLYVALSRVGQPDGVRIMVVGGRRLLAKNDTHVYTTNVVYKELLRNQ